MAYERRRAQGLRSNYRCGHAVAIASLLALAASAGVPAASAASPAAGPAPSGPVVTAPPVLLVAEETRVVREYRMPQPLGAVAIEASNASLQLTVAGRKVPLDVPELLRLPSTRLKEAVLGFSPERPAVLYLLIPCGFNADHSGPAGSVVVTIVGARVEGVESASCSRR
jgi:hypothetical protein